MAKMKTFVAMILMGIMLMPQALAKPTDKQHALTNSVKWQTQSAEYKFLTERTYHLAQQTLSQLVHCLPQVGCCDGY